MVFISWRLPDDPGGITCMIVLYTIMLQNFCTPEEVAVTLKYIPRGSTSLHMALDTDIFS